MARASATFDLSPVRIDFKLVRGDTWKMQFFFPEDPDAATPVGIDLTGSEWTADIKISDQGLIDPDADAPIFASFDVIADDQDTGYVYLELDEAVTREAVPGEFYWFDLQQKRYDETATPVQSRITVLPDVTIEGA